MTANDIKAEIALKTAKVLQKIRAGSTTLKNYIKLSRESTGSLLLGIFTKMRNRLGNRVPLCGTR